MKKYAIAAGTLSLLFGVNTQIARYDFKYKNVKRSITDAVTPNSNTFGSNKSLLIKSSPTDSLISPSRPNIPSVIPTISPKKNPTLSLPGPLKATSTAGAFNTNGSLKPTLRDGSSKLPSGSFKPTSINGSSKLPSGSFEPTSINGSSKLPIGSFEPTLSNTDISGPTPITDSSEPTSSITDSSEPTLLSGSFVPTPSITDSSEPTTDSSEPPSITESSEPTSMTDSCKSTWKPGCTNGKSVLQLVLKTDNYPNETKWNITNNHNTIVVEGKYNDKNNTHNESYCLDTNQCYIFRIFDILGDGICCESGVGFYKLYYDGYLMQEGGSFGTSDTSPPFGNCSPSMFPTKNPSLMPTTQLTGSLTNTPVSSSFLNFSEFLTLEGHTKWVKTVTFNPDGSKLASSSDDRTVKIWDTDGYELFQTLEGHSKSVSSIAFSPYGSKLASASRDYTIRVWDMDDGGSHIHTIEGYYSGSIAFNSVGSYLAFGSSDYAVVIWDITTTSTVSTFKGHTNMIMSVAFSPDGSKLASASLDKTIRTWDMNNDCHIQTLQGHDMSINSIAFSPNGKILASGSDDKTIRLWNIHTNKNSTLMGITYGVKEVAFSPDGKQLGAGLSDGTIMLWDMDTFELLQTLRGHRENVISSIAFSPNNRRNRYQLASGSYDRTIIIWDSLCPVGTYINASEFDCRPCAKGTYQNTPTFSNSCKLCPSGTYQSEEGGIKCSVCDLGSFQPLEGGASCEKCRAGGYCPYNVAANTCGGGFIPCPVGTFNEKNGTSDVSSCIPCPHGTYADKEGTTRCFQCPNRLDSYPNSTVCSFCAQDFYLKTEPVDIIELIEKTDEFCLPCPENVACDRNKTIETLEGDPGFWRDSLNTEIFYKCEPTGICLRDNKCLEGHGGVRCEVCLEENNHFKDGTCVGCPSYLHIGLVSGFFMTIAMLVIFYNGTCSFSSFNHYLDKIVTVLIRIGITAKLKILISFIQVVVTFGPVYGLTMHNDYKAFFDFLKHFNFGFAEVSGMPVSCMFDGAMKTRLIINGIWPYLFVLVIIGGKFIQTILVQMEFLSRKKSSATFWSFSIKVIIVTFYFALPSVSRSIFDGILCESFMSNDANNHEESYLVSGGLRCDDTNTEYQDLKSVFWIFFVMWPIAVPLTFLGLLLYIKKSVQSNRMKPLTKACRFLWSDYNESKMWWDFVDVFRKICLTGLVIFIDADKGGSQKIFRLLAAIICCIIYTTILALAQPYRRKEDLYLAVISNLLLTFCFVMGIMIHQCKEYDDVDGVNEVCENLFGMSMNSFRATKIVVLLITAMLFLSIGMITVLATADINTPTIRLVSDNSSPRMNIPADCKNHVFLSHVWDTGQNITHKIFATLKLYLPTIGIWLDVNDIADISKLENAVKDTVCFVLLYTKGYFQSRNCCRELNEALKERKPIIVIYQNCDDTYDDIHKMKEECRQFFIPAVPNFDAVRYIFATDPILWLSCHKQFTVETVKMIVFEVLKNLPYYQTHPTLLDNKLKIGGEIGPVGFMSPLEILICSDNRGADEIVSKLIHESRGSGEVSMCTVYPSDIPLLENGKERVMLLYLKSDLFSDPNNQIHETVKLILKEKIDVVLVHEKDKAKGGCPFCEIISQTPSELTVDPINLYKKNMAIDIYSIEEYQKVSLRQILVKMGAKPMSIKLIPNLMNTRMPSVRSSMMHLRSSMVSFGTSMRTGLSTRKDVGYIRNGNRSELDLSTFKENEEGGADTFKENEEGGADIKSISKKNCSNRGLLLKKIQEPNANESEFPDASSSLSLSSSVSDVPSLQVD